MFICLLFIAFVWRYETLRSIFLIHYETFRILRLASYGSNVLRYFCFRLSILQDSMNMKTVRPGLGIFFDTRAFFLLILVHETLECVCAATQTHTQNQGRHIEHSV